MNGRLQAGIHCEHLQKVLLPGLEHTNSPVCEFLFTVRATKQAAFSDL